MRQAGVEQFEGLVLSTARMNGGRFKVLGYDEDDVAQILRIKVLQALRAYKPERSQQTLKGYVFTCIANQVKDLRRNAANAVKDANGERVTESYIEDVAPRDGLHRDRFEAEHLAADAEQVFALAYDQFDLPSSLTERERRVVILLALDYQRKEVAEILCLSVSTVAAVRNRVQEKMADWRPPSTRAVERPSISIGELQLAA